MHQSLSDADQIGSWSLRRLIMGKIPAGMETPKLKTMGLNLLLFWLFFSDYYSLGAVYVQTDIIARIIPA
jgi:hypothetical protein